MNKASFCLLLSMCSSVSPVWAQQLNLFEPVESAPEEQPGRRQQVQPFVQAQPGSPAFTLRSSSRFGDLYRSTLVDRNGATVDVQWRAGEQVTLPGFTGFAVVGINSRELVLQHSGGEPCVASETVGVRCADSATSLLSLVMSEPLASNGRRQPPAMANQRTTEAAVMNGPDETFIMGPEGEAFVVNPFTGEPGVMGPQFSEAEPTVRLERGRARAERLDQFQPERINEDDVPAGMRLVRTPFGDRLVPVRE